MTQMGGGGGWSVSLGQIPPSRFLSQPNPTQPTQRKKRRELSALDCLHRGCQPTKHKKIEGPEENDTVK